jgi:hypothetical protein
MSDYADQNRWAVFSRLIGKEGKIEYQFDQSLGCQAIFFVADDGNHHLIATKDFKEKKSGKEG